MPAPLAKGLIVATTLLIAASLTIYENEEIRRWIELQRRKLAGAFQYGPDPEHPDAPPAADSAEKDSEKARATAVEDEEARVRREATIRRNLYLHGVEGVRARASTKEDERGTEPESPRLKRAGTHSFSDFLDGEGRLKGLTDKATTAASPTIEQLTSSNPSPPIESTAPSKAAATITAPTPISPHAPQSSASADPDALSRSSTPTLANMMTPMTLSPFGSPPAEAHSRANPFDEFGASSEEVWDSTPNLLQQRRQQEEDGVASRTLSLGNNQTERAADTMSDCGSAADWVSANGGASTPGDWSEVGSVVSGEEIDMVRRS